MTTQSIDNSPRFLITTADERSWRTDCPVLCLGEWCRTYGRSDAWLKLRAEVAPYHWDDREKLYRDYLYLHELHEVLLTELSDALNAFHGTQYSRRYWRILVGPWLLYFAQMLFDRWTMIQHAVGDYEISGTAVLDLKADQIIPGNMNEFRDMYPTDEWNHAIYGRILRGWTSVPCTPIPIDEKAARSSAVQPASMRTLGKSLRRLVVKGGSRFSQFLARKTDAFFILTFLPLKQELLLQLALGQSPTLNLPIPSPCLSPDLNVRERFSLETVQHKGFEHCVRTLIPEQIPTVYLEGYQSLQNTVKQLPWPKKPKVIFTSASYNADDVFKAWAGLRVEEHTPLVIGQHGGNLGSALWTSSEDHENAIADRYLTWGWSDGKSKQYPVGVLKHIGKGSNVWNPKGHLLLVTSVMPRYSYVMGSFTVAVGQTNANLEDQYRFVRALPKDIFENLVVRLFMPDWGWAQPDRWRDQIPGVRIDPGIRPIEPLIKDSRLYVATYNATTFLESLSRNIPTIMFWNPKHWELRASAESYFNGLRQVGIFHSCPEDAAAKVAEIWGNVDEWWNQPEVQEARKFFCRRYARIDKESFQDLHKALATVKPGQALSADQLL
jgi:putative transferase (TIGR04331 family)